MLKAILRMLATNIKHKYFIYKAAMRMGGFSRWHLLKHDLSKFSRSEFMHYVRRFEMGNPDPDGFGKAWEHHWKNNDHHTEYWEEKDLTFGGMNYGVPKKEGHIVKSFWMPDLAMREMIADWMGACRAYEGFWPSAGNWPWGATKLAEICDKLEATNQPETTTRGFLLSQLLKNDMISQEVHNKLNVL